MKFIDEKLLYLSEIRNFVYYEIELHNAYEREEEIRDYIAQCDYLDKVYEIKSKFSADVSMYDILELLGEFVEKEAKAEGKKQEEAERVINKICPELHDVGDLFAWSSVELSENTNEVYIDCSVLDGCSGKLVFKDALIASLAKKDNDHRYLWYELYFTDNGYCFEALTDDFEKIKIEFNDVNFEKRYYNAIFYRNYAETPWDELIEISRLLMDKYLYDSSLLNEKELELLPLIEFFSSMYCLSEKVESIQAICDLAEKFSLPKVKTLANKLITAKNVVTKDMRKKKFLDYLCKAECEPLWRKIYNDFCESQKGIPSHINTDDNLLQKNREKVVTMLKALGYKGEYPEFYKESSKRGLSIASSYGMDYFVANEKHMISIVRVCESNYFPYINLVCGTAFLKGKEYEKIKPDIFYTMFNEKGRRLFSKLYVDPTITMEQVAVIATKKAELKKLSKCEKEILAGFMYNSAIKFGVISMIVMGVLFATAFCIIFFIFACLMIMLDGESIVTVFEIPWWLMWIITAVGFGVPMGIIEIIKMRRGQ